MLRNTPVSIKLPLLGEVRTVVALIGGVVLVAALLFLLGLFIGRGTGGGPDDDGNGPDDRDDRPDRGGRDHREEREERRERRHPAPEAFPPRAPHRAPSGGAGTAARSQGP